jgi:cytochrome c oxidase cbb3-type subunit 3
MRRPFARAFLPALTLAAVSSTLLAQAPGTPAASPPDGERLYMQNCSECHGPEGDAIADADLGQGRFRRAATDPELIGIILRGIPNTAMPPHSFAEAQAAAIVAFLRGKANRAASAGGSAANGEALFSGKAQCTSCHRINGIGSRVGPDLSEIGRLRHSADIERAILDPDAVVVPSNRFVTLVTKGGETITGRLLNQDTFTVQLIDAKEQLRSLQRADLRELTFIGTSPMPSYRGKLAVGEVADLVSYLVSLKVGGSQ